MIFYKYLPFFPDQCPISLDLGMSSNVVEDAMRFWSGHNMSLQYLLCWSVCFLLEPSHLLQVNPGTESSLLCLVSSSELLLAGVRALWTVAFLAHTRQSSFAWSTR